LPSPGWLPSITLSRSACHGQLVTVRWCHSCMPHCSSERTLTVRRHTCLHDMFCGSQALGQTLQGLSPRLHHPNSPVSWFARGFEYTLPVALPSSFHACMHAYPNGGIVWRHLAGWWYPNGSIVWRHLSGWWYPNGSIVWRHLGVMLIAPLAFGRYCLALRLG
jgi:hypothetical protein